MLPAIFRVYVKHVKKARERWLAQNAVLVVSKQRHKTKVHVLLDMAMEQSQAGLIGDEIDRCAAECGNDHRVLLHSGGRLAIDFDKFEHMPVDV